MSLGIDKVAGKAILSGPWEAGYLEQFLASQIAATTPI